MRLDERILDAPSGRWPAFAESAGRILTLYIANRELGDRFGRFRLWAQVIPSLVGGVGVAGGWWRSSAGSTVDVDVDLDIENDVDLRC
ncbi:hypothetical protein CcI49_33935 [Frankia sp. CcI49]|uniref:hypothetical protein n=1 Tax=Frankia sp. CcI49 TaxID=1745382 RepID=UPI000976204E|nr:hypothetical protein [Frankia sp. CcI49]ONH52525.1 hypothetical protein CcI49_33935 [Frankia sp. CcI49]